MKNLILNNIDNVILKVDKKGISVIKKNFVIVYQENHYSQFIKHF